jgi:predicted GNAT family N-acyltransferase
MSNEISVEKVQGEPQMSQVLALRKAVFVEEQGVPPDIEYAGDESAHHFLATRNGRACGTARWRRTGGGFKLERFAVLPEYRKTGAGAALLSAVLADLPDDPVPTYLNAQLSAVGFYERYGFRCVGEVFEEAGIAHRKMEKVPGR